MIKDIGDIMQGIGIAVLLFCAIVNLITYIHDVTPHHHDPIREAERMIRYGVKGESQADCESLGSDYVAIYNLSDRAWSFSCVADMPSERLKAPR
mgnify:CR=1 FL=1